jgi:hypothetical protein
MVEKEDNEDYQRLARLGVVSGALAFGLSFIGAYGLARSRLPGRARLEGLGGFREISK